MVFQGIKKLIGKMPSMNAAFGDVVYEANPMSGQSSHSFLQWRVKRSTDGRSYFVGLKLRPDYYAGPDGSPMNYINLSVEAAEQAVRDLEKCIAECRRLST